MSIKTMSFEAFPEARSGAIMRTYYDYIILFGGVNVHQEYINDLWIYSIQKCKIYYS